MKLKDTPLESANQSRRIRSEIKTTVVMIRKVMAFSGPRMSYRHPILTIFHLLDKFRKPAERSAHPSAKDI